MPRRTETTGEKRTPQSDDGQNEATAQEVVSAVDPLPDSGESAPAVAPAPRRRRGRPPASSRRGATPADTPEPAASDAPGPASSGPRQRGRIATDTHAAIERLVGKEQLTKSQAFERLGAESGRSASAVATAYYRAARVSDAPARRARRAPALPASAAARPESSGTAAALAAIRAALDQLAAAVERQEQELLRAHAESERYGRIRDIVGAEVASAASGRGERA